MSKVGTGLQHTFDLLGSHVLAVGGHDQVLLTVGDPEKTFLVEAADVTSVKPSTSHRLARFHFVFVISQHDGRTARENLSVLSDLHLNVPQGLANSSQLEAAPPVYGDHWRGFGQPIPLQNQDSHAEEKVCQLLVKRSTSRNKESQPSA